jgi:2'-5' RNA ligase
VVSYGINDNKANTNLNLLVNECKRIQDECGLKSKPRDFIPHITAIKKVQKFQLTLNIKPVLWQANEFVLVMSELTEQGSVYTVLYRWNLFT